MLSSKKSQLSCIILREWDNDRDSHLLSEALYIYCLFMLTTILKCTSYNSAIKIEKIKCREVRTSEHRVTLVPEPMWALSQLRHGVTSESL